MHIAVIGAGAVGGFFGAVLRNAGHRVTFLARGNHLQAMKKDGLFIHSGLNSFQVYGTFTDDMADVRDADLLLFSVKSTDTRQMAEAVSPFLKMDSIILTVQNGVDNEEVLTGIFGEDRVLAGSAYITSRVDKPGVIRQEGTYSLVIGAMTSSSKDKAAYTADLFQSTGIDCRLSDSILERKWDKLLWNVTFNPLSAAARATIADILDHPPLHATAQKALHEAVEIARAEGIEIRQKVIDRIFPQGEAVRHHKTSMLQDLESGRAMEVESLCGYFVRKAHIHGIQVPVLSTMYSILTSLDQGNNIAK